MKTLYNIDVVDEGDQYLVLVEKTLDSLAQSLVPGKFLVEHFPFLRYIPSWVPGAGFQTQFAEWRVVIETLRDMPFKNMKRNTVSDYCGNCHVCRAHDNVCNRSMATSAYPVVS